jgi:tRNA/rRNA methyltransferase
MKNNMTPKNQIKNNGDENLLANIGVVLMEPKFPENIGSAARVMANMGLSRLIIVRNEFPDKEKMLKMATHKAAYIIENMEFHTELAPALKPFAKITGTTARYGRHRKTLNSPKEMATRIIPILENNQAAILFGNESRGLTNDDLKYCDWVVSIPTRDFSSLNLAQSVAILCYELHMESVEKNNKEIFEPKLANSFELEGMYSHLEELLGRIDFLKNNDDYWMGNIRRFLGRFNLQAKEVKIIRGFCRQFLWHNREKNKDF